MQHSLDGLEALARQFNTDKQAGQNEYLALYLEYFKRHGFKRDDPLQILEIGTNKGSSLRAWAEYFPNSQVFGLDITRQYELPGMLDRDNIHTEICDAGNAEELEAALRRFNPAMSQFDIIIDDGSHDQSDMQVSWGFLFHYLVPGGLYVIEDIITGENWWDANLYNKKRVIPTRNIVKQLEAGMEVKNVDAIPDGQWSHILDTMEYCEYRESPAIIYERHHPQLAFVGKKNG